MLWHATRCSAKEGWGSQSPVMMAGRRGCCFHAPSPPPWESPLSYVAHLSQCWGSRKTPTPLCAGSSRQTQQGNRLHQASALYKQHSFTGMGAAATTGSRLSSVKPHPQACTAVPHNISPPTRMKSCAPHRLCAPLAPLTTWAKRGHRIDTVLVTL